MTDMVIRPAAKQADVGALPSSIDIDAEISALETHLARLHTARAARTAEDSAPWTLDHTDDDWEDSPAVGATAFSRHAHRAGLLTADEEVGLARRIEAGAFAQERLDSGIELKRTQRRGLEHVVREGDEARERMIMANTRLVNKIARAFMPRSTASMNFEDLQQAGFLGLMRAVDKFDHAQGYKFSTYATWWIKQSISRAIDDESRTVRLPVHMADTCRRIDTARRRASLTWADAVADPARLGDDVDVSQVERARDLLRPWLSLEHVDHELDVLDDTEPALDVLADRLDAERTWRRLADHLVSTPGLGPRAVEILELRHGLRGEDPMTLDQIGRRFGVTRERIRQIEKKALEAVRVDQVNLVNHH